MNITLSINIVFFNKVAFMVMISNNLIYITSEYIPSRRQELILSVMKRIKNA